MQFRELLDLLKTLPAAPTDERRGSVRLRCAIEVRCRADGSDFQAQVVDVTPRGLGLELSYGLRPKQVVKLARESFGAPISAEVLWVRRLLRGQGYRVGLLFHAEAEQMRQSWLAPALKQSGFKAEIKGEQRKLLRVPGRVACRLEGGKGPVDGEMLDLSMGGATVETSSELEKGRKVSFATLPLGGLPSLSGTAQVVSCRKRDDQRWRSGLRFLDCNQDCAHLYMRSMLASVWAGKDLETQ